MYLLNKISQTSLKFNLKEFIDNQDKIWTKYDSLSDGLDLIKSEKDFINNFDRYILHSLEEVYEVSNSSDLTETIEEVIDVLMYLGTCYAIVRENSKKYFNEQRYELTFSNTFYVFVKHEEIQLTDLTSMILCNLMSLRRCFNKRKWHKVSEEMTIEQKLNSLDYMENCIKLCMINVLQYAIQLVTFTEKENPHLYINEVITNKQNFVINLKGINQ